MITCSICNRNFKNPNSLRSHRSEFHRRNRKDDDKASTIEHDDLEDGAGIDYENTDSTSTYEDEDMIVCSAQNKSTDFNLETLLDYPKFLKMICKGILNGSFPISKDLLTKLKAHAPFIRNIAVKRIKRLRHLLDNHASRDSALQLVMLVYQQSIIIFKK